MEEREAATKAKEAREPEERRTQRGSASMVPRYRLMKISCPVCHAKPGPTRRGWTSSTATSVALAVAVAAADSRLRSPRPTSWCRTVADPLRRQPV